MQLDVIGNTIKLIIHKTIAKNAGTYELIVVNAVGSITLPLDDGDLSINSYFVEYRDMCLSQTVRCERLLNRTFSYESNRLIKGSKYTIRILAENKLDQSQSAEIIEAFIVKHLFDVPNASIELKVLGATKSTG
ncbi:unnamed protein product [Rotaria sp. Silwood2]|nr:unnamed protein product [Rotaria sp. Silwood2]CAF4305618.1 unnamed protein product [Rotaria sp. Silwood2]